MPEMGKQFAHERVALSLLPGQFSDSANLRALVSSFVGQAKAVQELESAVWDLYSLRWLWIAEGAALDGIGDILEEPRASDDDEEYRAQLYLKILINVSQSEPERLIEATQRATGASEVHLIEKRSATALLYAHELTDTAFISRIEKVAAGGVKTVLTASESAAPFVFGVDRDASGTGFGSELSYGDGWGESGVGNEDIGGDIAEIFLDD